MYYFCVFNRPTVCGSQWQDEFPHWYYLPVAAAFGTAFLHNLVSIFYEKKAAKSQLAMLVCYINAVAGVFELLCWAGVIPVFFTAEGRPFQLMRYIMWAHATAAMVYVMSLLSDFKRLDIALTVALDVVMIVTAPLGDLTLGFWRYFWWGVSFAAFPPLGYQMWRMLDSAVRATDDEETKKALRGFRTMTLSLWSGFPVIWTLVQMGYISYGTEELLWSVSDLAGKVLFSCSLLHTNFMSIEDRRLAAMRVVEEANRVKVIHELKELVEQKQQFLALMSHELRTPLNGIIGLSDGLLVGSCGPLDRRVAKTVSAVRKSGKRLLTVINEILDAATCFKGELIVNFHKVELGPLFDDVVELTRPLMAKGVVLENRLDMRASQLHVGGDFNRIVQIMHNLLGNAAKFTPSGKVWVDAEVVENRAAVQITVGDTGVGIPPESVGTIFTSFRQVDMKLSRKYAGSGLGLSVVRQLVEAHKGSICVESTPGKGSIFRITLPAWLEGVHPRQCGAAVTTDNYCFDNEVGAMDRVRRSSEFQTVFSRLQQELRAGAERDVAGDEILAAVHAASGQQGQSNAKGEQAGAGSSPMQAGQVPPLPRRADTEEADGTPRGRLQHDGPMCRIGSCMSLETSDSFDYTRLGCCPDNLRGMSRGPSVVGFAQGCSLDTVDSGREAGVAASAAAAAAATPEVIPEDAGPSGKPAADPSTALAAAAVPSAARGQTAAAAPPAAAAAPVGRPPGQGDASGIAGTNLNSWPFDTHAAAPGVQASNAAEAPVATAPAPAVAAVAPAAVEPVAAAAAPAAAAVEAPLGGSVGGTASAPAGVVAPKAAGLGSIPQQRPPVSTAAAAANGTCKKVLSVDDDPVNQLVIRRFLQRGGYEIKQAADGQQALDILFGNGYRPDIILLDVMMPGMNGFEVCRKVREHYPPTQLPVIMVSANGMWESIQEGQEAGSNDYVTKPFSCHDLLSRIEAQLRRKSLDAAATAVATMGGSSDTWQQMAR